MNKKQSIYTLSVKSEIENTFGITNSDIEKIINLATTQAIIDFWNEHKEKRIKEMEKYPVAVWQLNKSFEMRQLFWESLTYAVSDETISMEVSYNIELPFDWDWGDLYTWMEGLHKVTKDFLFGATFDGKPEDSNHYKKSLDFLNILFSNEKFSAKRDGVLMKPKTE